MHVRMLSIVVFPTKNAIHFGFFITYYSALWVIKTMQEAALTQPYIALIGQTHLKVSRAKFGASTKLSKQKCFLLKLLIGMSYIDGFYMFSTRFSKAFNLKRSNLTQWTKYTLISLNMSKIQAKQSFPSIKVKVNIPGS